MSYVTTAEAVRKARLGAALIAFLCDAMLLFAIGSARLTKVSVDPLARTERLVVRTLFSRVRLTLARCAFGLSVTHGGRGGPSYEIYAADGTLREKVAEAMTERGADRATRRLERCFGIDDTPARSPARAQAAAARAQWQRDRRAAQDYVDAHYRSGGFARVGRWMLVAVVVYCMAMLVVAWLTGWKL
jgi:hypothetical protein